MKRSILFLVVLVVLTASPALAQDKSGCTLGVDIMWLSASGIENRVGDVFTYHEDVTLGTPVAPLTVLNYGVDSTPIILKPKSSRQRYLLEGSCRKGGWRVVIRGWNASFSGALQDEVESKISSNTAFSVTGIGMWGQKLVPVVNQNYRSGFSSVKWHGENTTKVAQYQLLAESSFVNTAHKQLALVFGLSFGQVTNFDAKGEAHVTHIDEPARRIGFEDGSFYDVDAFKFDNAISLEGVSSAEIPRMMGPTLGVSGAFERKAFEFDWRITQSMFLGKKKTKNLWVDIDNIVIVDGDSNEQVFLHGVFKTSQEDRVVIPVLDLAFKVRLNITRHISVSGGVFSSSWFMVPIAPQMDFPGEWTALAGTRSIESTANLMIKGWTAEVRLKF